MSHRNTRRAGAFAAAAGLAAITAVAVAAPGSQTGPSSSVEPYVVRSQPGVVTTSIISAGDSVNARGTRIDDHTLLATQIEVEGDGSGHH